MALADLALDDSILERLRGGEGSEHVRDRRTRLTKSLGELLCLYVGFFLFMGATDLLPEAHEHPSAKRVLLTAGGFIATFIVARAASGA